MFKDVHCDFCSINIVKFSLLISNFLFRNNNIHRHIKIVHIKYLHSILLVIFWLSC